jgi:trans-aconitate 2-methyltransferase
MSSHPNNYSWNAKDYAKHSSAQFEWAKELFPKLNLKGDENLLDIGCGDGKITAALSRILQNGKVVGIDSSNEMISLAQRSYPRKKYPNLSFQKMDARKLTFNEQFDVVFSNAALHWVVNHYPLLLGVERSLRKQGRILFQMGGKGNAQQIISLLDNLLAEEPWKKYFKDFKFPYRFFSPQEYTQLLIEARLKPERVELIPKDMVLKGREGLISWIRTTWLPYIDRIPSMLQNQFIADIVDRHLSNSLLGEKGEVYLKMMRLEVQASKASSY